MVRQMKDSGVEWIGEIPENTKLMQLRFIADITTGNMDTQNREDDGEYPFYVRSPKIERSNQYSFDDIEAILMAGDGVGAGRVFHYVQGKYACHQRVYRMSNFKFVQSHFLKYYLEGLFPMIMDQGSAKSTVDSVRLPMLQGFKVVVFNESEQQKIAEFLDEKVGEINSVIAKTKETIEDYKKYKQTIITDAVTKGLNPDVEMKESGIEWLGNIPVHWDKIVLKKVSTKPISYGVIKLFDPDENGVKILRCSDIKDGYIIEDAIRTITKELSNEYSRTILQSGDVVINVRGTLGGCAVVPESMNGYNIAREVALIAIDKEKYFSNYIMYCLLSKTFENFRDYSLSGCIYLGINMETLSKFMCPLPSLKEQREIAEYLDEECSEIDNLIAKKEELLADLEDYKKSLIYEYVTGKKEVG